MDIDRLKVQAEWWMVAFPAGCREVALESNVECTWHFS
jgi:hypothetical protein